MQQHALDPRVGRIDLQQRSALAQVPPHHVSIRTDRQRPRAVGRDQATGDSPVAAREAPSTRHQT
jgi:hypothetical protein